MPSAIELYQQAYDADYRKGNWEYAKELYETILRTYPHSEEAEYCRVHLDRLERLRSDPHNNELQAVQSKRGPSALSVMCLVLVVPLIAAVVVCGYYVWQQYNANLYYELLMEGQINERAGLYDPAVRKYEAAQAMMPTNALSYRLLAELYLQNSKFPLADVQRKGWQLTYPEDPDLAGFEARMKIKLAENAGRK
jgi:outer membrane protein assembly factor BamD (BamD/ComL family)